MYKNWEGVSLAVPLKKGTLDGPKALTAECERLKRYVFLQKYEIKCG